MGVSVVQPEEPAGSQMSDLTIESPDWKTFEEVESYTTGDTVRTLGRLLPARLWDYLFAPTKADPETLERHRCEVSEQYLSVIKVYEESKRQLRVKSGLDSVSESDRTITELLEEVDERWYPASVESQEEYESLTAYLNRAEAAISEERAAAKTSEQLLSEPEAAFLREEEREKLKTAQTVLQYSANRGEEMKEGVAQKREAAIETLDQRVPEWEQEIDQLEEQADPYLELEEYLSENDVLEAIKSVQDRFTAVRKAKPIHLLSHPLCEQFQRLETRIVTLREELEESRHEYAQMRLKQLQETAESAINDIQDQLKPAKEQGESITSPEHLISEINELRSDLKEFRTTPWSSELAETRTAELTQYELQLDNLEGFIDEKTQFDSQYETHLKQFQEVRADASPYLNYEQYLTRLTRADLSDRISSLKTDVEAFADEVRFNLLSENDLQRCDQLQQDIDSIETHLKDYNAEFVRRQRKACATLFSGIGPQELELTEEQERAVIRNGIYNQVVAAAGTGKTLTLTTRVAYLIKEQNIEPDQILVVTYTRNATKEMWERLDDQFGITDVEVRTINSFGNKIIQESHDDYVDTIGGHEQSNLIDRQIRKARNAETSEFLDHYFEFLVHFDDVYYEEEDFETKEKYVEARAEEDYVTLKGAEVKSRAEKLIADFLYTHQVDYRYEDRATWADTASEKAGYTPDFYLPEYDVYIEHWGVDEAGSIAPWFSWSSEEYRDKMRWARQQFADVEYELIDTYEFEHETNRLRQALRHRLVHRGVELDRMSFEELIETAFEYEQREGWIKDQFQSFIQNAKRFDVMPDDIETNLSPQNPRQYHFGHCGIHLLQQYALYLTRNRLIDYTDQIHDAVELVQKHPETYQDRYEHILVDEFQDIGSGKLELIQALTGPGAAKLFAVGDDWQSIYSFQGAVVEYFTQFGEYFGDPVRTDLTANFRSPSSVIQAGNQLIEHNSEQLEKTVRATMEFDAVPQIHALRGYKGRFYDYVRRVRRYTVSLVQEYLAVGADPTEIMVLCRYDSAVPYLDEIKSGLKSQEIPYIGKSDQYQGPSAQQNGVSVYSIHQAKGKEAKHVILVHAAEGPYGIPPDDRENELLDPVQPFGAGGIEEERRAFYVAVTRARHSLDFLTRADQESQFLDEIADHTERVDTGQVEPLEEVGERMSVEVQVDKLLDSWQKQQQRGILADKYGGSARFVSWESDAPPTLEHGEWYHISNVLVGEYKDEKELVITDTTSVTHLPEGPKDPETAELPEMG